MLVLSKQMMVKFGIGVKNKYINVMENITEKIKIQLEEAGYDYAVAVATETEIDAGAACGQLSIITEEIVATEEV